MRAWLEKIGIGPAAGLGGALALFGIWTQHVWIFWVNTNNPCLPAWAPWQAVYLMISCCMLAGGVAVAKRGGMPRRVGDAIDLSASAAGCVGTLVILLSQTLGVGAPALAVVGLVACGAAFGWANLRWGELYAGLDIRQAIAFLFTAGIVAAAGKTVLFLLPLVPSGLVATSLPLASCAWYRGGLALTQEEGSGATASQPKPPVLFPRQSLWALWKVALVFAVFSVVDASMLSLLEPSQSVGTAPVFLAERGIETLLCAAVLLFIFRFDQSFDFAQLWRVVLLILATDLLVNIVHPGSMIQTLFAGVSLNFIVLFVWLVLADVARHSDVHPFGVFGVGWSCYTLAFFLGSLPAPILGLTSSSVGYFGVLLYLVCIVAAFCLEVRDQDTKRIFHDLSSVAVPSDFVDIDSRCEAIAKERNLTPRELEIMQMLCKGRSKPYIAEKLFVTENTVKGHTKRLYAKLGVHSREELQRLIDVV